MQSILEKELRDYLGREKWLFLELNKISFRSDDAQRHIKFGLYRRVDMIRYSRRVIREIASAERHGPLDPDQTNRINVHVNSLYTHFRGGLDNLAWALAHEYELFEPMDESHRSTRQKCQLFGDAFLRALARCSPALVAALQRKKDWANRLKELRDPVAHRIPLYVPRGTLSNEEAEAYRSLHDQARVALSEGDPETHWAKVSQAEAIGSFADFVLLSEPDGLKSGPLLAVVDHDHSEFMDISEAVCTDLNGSSQHPAPSEPI